MSSNHPPNPRPSSLPKHRAKFSIVINTLNRGPSLDATLKSFCWLRYEGAFEVIVVNGPSTDDSAAVIARWGTSIRSAECPVANLSVSRNIGIAMASGELIAFIDDDAIPEPEWLEQLAAAYEDPLVGAVGGLVYDHTGYNFQYRYCLVDRLGNADLSLPGPTPHLSFPKSYRFPHLLGANSSFRTSALIQIGGFDEEYEYFLDETDVCLRIVDAGWIIAQREDAYVHHKFAPSNLRGTNRVAKYRFSIIKNKVYFTLKHAREFFSLDGILRAQLQFIDSQRNEMTWAFGERMISQSDLDAFGTDVERAIEIGWQRGLEGARPEMMLTVENRAHWRGDFLSFAPLANQDHCTLVLVSKDFPPDHGGGIATFNKDLAEAFAARGNVVHVITLSPDINRVDFENGVWIHRMVVRDVELSADAVASGIPPHIWNWSAVAYAEVERLSTHRKIDVVEAPIWDCEGIAFALAPRWPLVTSLQTTLHFWLDSHPHHRDEAAWMTSFGRPMLAAERRIMEGSDAVRSISKAIRTDIESSYGFRFAPDRVVVLPLGMSELPRALSVSSSEPCTVLFVGRLEARKGIDVLLAAIPLVLEQEPTVLFRIVGDDSLLGPNGRAYSESFLTSDAGRRWHERIFFEGRVNEDRLRSVYSSCDIFVSPSRYESFGLVFLEAMREGKPVIGCDVGGMPELINDGENGLLITPGNVRELADALLTLVRSEPLRQRFGQAGREIFETRFTAQRMAANSVQLYRLAATNYQTTEA